MQPRQLKKLIFEATGDLAAAEEAWDRRAHEIYDKDETPEM